MYYPYLRARQFELITIRDLVAEGAIQYTVCPVFEPVKESVGNLSLAHKVLKDKDFNCFLIVNPFVGELAGDRDFFLEYISTLEDCKFLPAFHYADNSEYILQSINDYGLTNCMLICLDNFSDEDSLKTLCENPAFTHIMLLDPNKYRNLNRFIKALNKVFIRLDDVFEKQQKNADYLDVVAHKFSEEHLYYGEENYQGFADFTVLSREFIDGGSTPRAVVIHLTYLNSEAEDEIWIRHFTSITNDSIANVQGKFAEAAGKAIEYCDNNHLTNSAIEELRTYYDETRYPGLGTVKKISIKNHLLVVRNFLSL